VFGGVLISQVPRPSCELGNLTRSWFNGLKPCWSDASYDGVRVDFLEIPGWIFCYESPNGCANDLFCRLCWAFHKNTLRNLMQPPLFFFMRFIFQTTFCKFIKELTKICQLFLELFQKWSLAMIACLFAKSWIMWYLCLSLFLGKATLAGGDLALKVQGQQLLLLLRLHHLTFAPPQTFGHLPFSSVLARSTLISSRRTSCHISCS